MHETYTELLTQIVADLQQARGSRRLDGTPPTDELYRLWFNYKRKLEIHTTDR